jgi:hypothetical protein
MEAHCGGLAAPYEAIMPQVVETLDSGKMEGVMR